MNTYTNSIKSLQRLDKETQIRALSFTEYLVNQSYDAFCRKVSKEEYLKHIKEKKKEIKYLKNYLKIKC